MRMSTMDKPRGDTIRYMRPPLLLTRPRQRCAVRCRVLCGARRCAMRCGVVWWELSSRFADVRCRVHAVMVAADERVLTTARVGVINAHHNA